MNGLPSFVLALSLVIVLIAGTDAGTVPNDSGKAVSRQRRSAAITFPSMTILRVVLDAFIPVIPLLNSTLTYLNFNMPFRITVPTYKQMIDLYSSLGRMEEHGILLDHNFLDEHRANQDRRSIYKLVEGLFNSVGFNGESCVRRAICELTEAPLGHNGLFGKAIHLLLPKLLKFPESMQPHFQGNRTRRELLTEDLDFIEEPVEDDYTAAHRAGLDGKCWTRYSKCPISIFKILNI